MASSSIRMLDIAGSSPGGDPDNIFILLISDVILIIVI